MPTEGHSVGSDSRNAAQFATTHWSVVLAARGGRDEESRLALATLCGNYWYPLYAYLRRRGYDSSDAQDLTQGFFARLLEKDGLQSVDPERGRFRAYLLAAIKHYASNEWDRQHAQKRGGYQQVLSFDFGDAESRYLREPQNPQTPESLFQRRWALTLLDKVTSVLEKEYSASGRTDLFRSLQPYLAGDEARSYSDVATVLGMTDGAVRTAVHRLRRRFGQLLRAEIAQTVSQAEDVDEEIRALFDALRS